MAENTLTSRGLGLFGFGDNNTDFGQFLGSQGLDQAAFVKLTPGEQAGVNQSFTNLKNTGGLQSTVNEGYGAQGAGGGFGLGDALGVAQGLGALGSAYTAYKGLGLAEDQFGFEKALANRNLANQGQLINTQLQNAADVGLALGGGAMTPEQIAASKAATAKKFVDTSKIG